MEIIFKNNPDSILKIKKRVAQNPQDIHYYDSGFIYILGDDDLLRLKCESIQEFAFQMVDYVADVTANRSISDNNNYNLVLHLVGDDIILKEEWMEVNYFKELKTNLNLMRDQVLRLYDSVNKELEILIPDIAKSTQFRQHLDKLKMCR